MTDSSSVPPPSEFLVLAKTTNTVHIASILGTICHKKDQTVVVTLKPTGIKFTVEEARTVQGSAFLVKDIFQEYHYNRDTDERFAINLSVFLECLNIFGPVAPQSPPPTLQIAYRGHGTPFLAMLELNDVLTDCAIRTIDAEPLMLFNIRGADILCKLIVKSDCLKDAFNELDWTNLSCAWLVSNEQPYFRLSTDGTGASCQVDYPKESEVFEVFESSNLCEFKYKMKHMQPCAKALSVAQKTQIRINAQGLLSMQHRIQFENAAPCYVEFYLVPLEEDEEAQIHTRMEF